MYMDETGLSKGCIQAALTENFICYRSCIDQ